MTDQALVIVSDPDDAKHAEINFVESVPKARLVETLLEAGFDQTRIRVFVGGEMVMQVRQRPIVTLVDDNESSEPALETDSVPVPSSTDGKSPQAGIGHGAICTKRGALLGRVPPRIDAVSRVTPPQLVRRPSTTGSPSAGWWCSGT